MHESQISAERRPDGSENNKRVEKHLGISPPSSILTEWGLNLTGGMKETIIALICGIITTVKRTGRDRQNKSRFGKGLKQPQWRGKWSQLWDSLFRACIQRYQKKTLKAELWIHEPHGYIWRNRTKPSRLTAITHSASTANNYEHNKNAARSTEPTFNCNKYSNVVASAFFNKTTTENTLYHAQPALLFWLGMLINFVQSFVYLTDLKVMSTGILLYCYDLQNVLYSASMWMCSECDITPFKFVWEGAFLCIVLALQTVEVLCFSRRRKSKFTFQFSSW